MESTCLPRGIPAASLKPDRLGSLTRRRVRLPRGIPAASLKQGDGDCRRVARPVFRGEYPRPH